MFISEGHLENAFVLGTWEMEIELPEQLFFPERSPLWHNGHLASAVLGTWLAGEGRWKQVLSTQETGANNVLLNHFLPIHHLFP